MVPFAAPGTSAQVVPAIGDLDSNNGGLVKCEKITIQKRGMG